MPFIGARRILRFRSASLVVPSSSCSGTAVSSASPNDLSNSGVWTQQAVDRAFGESDPIGGTNATKITCNNTQADVFVYETQGSQLTASVTYVFTAYAQPISGSTWIQLSYNDFAANAFGAWFNLSGAGSVGTVQSIGNGTCTCQSITTSTNGFYYMTFAGNYSGAQAGNNHLLVRLSDGDNSVNATNGQAVTFYQVNP